MPSKYLIQFSAARKNISNLRYADETTLMTESKEEVKSLLMKVKEENENHSQRKQTNLITWTTALSNLAKL